MAAALVAYGTCQTGCNAVWTACYAAAGVVAGTVTAGAAAPVAILGCNSAQGICMTACAGVTLAGGAAEVTAGAVLGPAVAVSAAVAGAAWGAYKWWRA